MGKHKKKATKRPSEEIPEKDLDRFAGSSEEEADDENDEEEEESDLEEQQQHGGGDDDDDDEDHGDDEYEQEDQDSDPQVNNDAGSELAEQDDDDDDDSDEIEFASGMAQAMSKILGTTTSTKSSTSVVLSKTTTPLQRMAMKEKQLQQEMKEKRRANRERNLQALHIPLSVATSRDISNSNQSVAQELESERTHRRVATRGVVALFNAIAQHQKKQHETQESAPKHQKEEVKKLSKHGFLDMIKSAAAAKTSTVDESRERESPHSKTSSRGEPSETHETKNKWNALQDDYMLNSKLQDWDKESSDEEDNGGDAIQEDWSDNDNEESSPAQKPNKKRRVSVQ